jgi:2Fe-2S iron-sulfur cluster binding domain
MPPLPPLRPANNCECQLSAGMERSMALSNKTISVRIDGELVNAREGQTILEVAHGSRKQIPTLCF